MKNLKFFVTLMAVLLMWSGCKEDEVEQLKPDVEIGNVTYNDENTMAFVEVTPSESSVSWYWKNIEKDGTDVEFTKVTGNESTKLEIAVQPGKTYVLSVYSENQSGTSDVKTKEFTTGEGQSVEFSMTIKNVSPFSIDVDVIKGTSCEKYAIGMMPEASYSEDRFIESAKTSFNPEPSYPYQPYNWSDKDDTFNEQTLYKGTLSSNDVSEGVKVYPGEKYYVAACLMDAEGNVSVVKEEVNFPAATVDEVTAGLDVVIDIKDEDITNTSVSATFTAPEACKKILVTVIPGDTSYDELTSDEERNALILSIGNGVNVMPYTGTFTHNFKTILDYGAKYMVCAIPIDENGKIGNIACKKFSAKTPELDGTGSITSATVVSAENNKDIIVTMKVSDNVNKVRVYYATDKEYLGQMNDMDMIMSDDINDYLRTDYTKAEVEAGIQLYVPESMLGEGYHIFASTIDTDGKISKPQDVVLLSNPSSEGIFQTTKPEEEGITFDGTGKATLIVEETSNDGMEVAGTFKVVKGENSEKVFRLYVADEHPENVEELVQKYFSDYPELPALVKELDFDENGQYEEAFSSWLVYDAKYGGQLLMIVTMDSNNKFKITSYYSAGSGAAVNY